jgi:hypothetical protein
MTEKPPENAASDIYRHPRVQGSGNRDSSTFQVNGNGAMNGGSGGNSSGYKKSYDLYSLGIIFLEIAYWTPIDRILQIPDLQNARPSVTIKARQRLLDDKEGVLKYVKSHLGDTVEGVVKACLEGPKAFGIGDTEDERREEVAARLQAAFWERVVGRLGEMRV